MKRFKILIIVGVILVLVFLSGVGLYFLVNKNTDSWICENGEWVKQGNPNSLPPIEICLKNELAEIGNPASQNCLDKGGQLEIRKNIMGDEYGVCLFVNGKECEEWSFFRGECFIEEENNSESRKEEKTKLILPLADELLFETVVIEGEMPGDWYFEAVAILEIADSFGNILGQGIAIAESDWMTTSSVAFKGIVELATTTATTGTLKLKNSNPSGLIELEKSEIYPVVFGEQLKVYFGNSEFDKEQIDCANIFPVFRVIEKNDLEAPKNILQELLKGPNETELEEKYFTGINQGVKINNFILEKDIVTIDFSEDLEKSVGGSCRVTMIRAQIEQTLKQFKNIKNIIISINGKTEDILQP